MPIVKRLLLVLLIFVALAISAVALLGWLLPENHVVTRSVALAAPPDKVWQLISNVQQQPNWRKELKSVSMLPDLNGQPHWQENASMDAIPYVLTESDAPHRRVVKIAGKEFGGPDLGFGGTWTFDLVGSANATRLSITEQGAVQNIFFRFMSRYVFGYSATIDQYQADLAKAVT